MKPIAEIHFTAHIIREYSSTPAVENLGNQKCSMTLYASDEPTYYCIEWIIGENHDEVVHYGIWIQHIKGKRTLTDYDGGFNLPRRAISLLRTEGFVVPKDFE